MGLAGLLAVMLSGCVTVYQPLVSLQRPVIIEPQAPNFEGLRLLVRCVPGDYLKPADAVQLCRHLRTLFTNQGAQVDTDVPRNGVSGRGWEDTARPDLVIDLRSRLLHEDKNALLWGISWFTLTLVPSIEEDTFSQEVTIRDADGFLLASDVMQGRFMHYFGIGVWGVNAALDLLVRPESEKLTGDVAKRDFSRDFYGQLSQLAFHARMRSMVLRSFEPEPSR
jgi:hypothetical protein